LSQFNPFQTLQPISPRSIQIPSIYASVFQVVFRGAFPPKSCTTFLCGTCFVHLILLDLIYLMIFGVEYKLWSSSLCSFLHSRVT
jgi:hypothetical protein